LLVVLVSHEIEYGAVVSAVPRLAPVELELNALHGEHPDDGDAGADRDRAGDRGPGGRRRDGDDQVPELSEAGAGEIPPATSISRNATTAVQGAENARGAVFFMVLRRLFDERLVNVEGVDDDHDALEPGVLWPLTSITACAGRREAREREHDGWYSSWRGATVSNVGELHAVEVDVGDAPLKARWPIQRTAVPVKGEGGLGPRRIE